MFLLAPIIVCYFNGAVCCNVLNGFGTINGAIESLELKALFKWWLVLEKIKPESLPLKKKKKSTIWDKKGRSSWGQCTMYSNGKGNFRVGKDHREEIWKDKVKHAVYQIPAFCHHLKAFQRIQRFTEVLRMGKSQVSERWWDCWWTGVDVSKICLNTSRNEAFRLCWEQIPVSWKTKPWVSLRKSSSPEAGSAMLCEAFLLERVKMETTLQILPFTEQAGDWY